MLLGKLRSYGIDGGYHDGALGHRFAAKVAAIETFGQYSAENSISVPQVILSPVDIPEADLNPSL